MRAADGEVHTGAESPDVGLSVTFYLPLLQLDLLMTSAMPSSPAATDLPEPLERALLRAVVRHGIWLFGIPSWLYGLADRGMAAAADGYLSLVEVFYILSISLLFTVWLRMKPNEYRCSDNAITLQRYQLSGEDCPSYLQAARVRMVELYEQHIVGQAYILPFPYYCQIYHLLNLKHLESVHSFSLGNLKVLGVDDFQTTPAGGIIRFRTALSSSAHVLRLWRRPEVDVELVLHDSYTVELRIPVYGDKRIIVLFNVLPVTDQCHQLFIDIYSDLNWPKPLLTPLLDVAASLTLLEDLSYLRQLAERGELPVAQKIEQHALSLLNRFVERYGSAWRSRQTTSL
ncbi:MAG: hypothetical protein ACFB5Z_19670 [Elainellaceae cyanobacterium]